jgi:hypothetical protein
VKCPNCSTYMFGKPDPLCPVCDGTGYVTCPECGGVGIDVREGDQINDANIDGGGKKMENVNISLPFDWTFIGVSVVAVVAIGAFVFVKQKKVSEKHLREVSSNEFQNWVVQRFSGKVASQREARIGIDGYTGEGYPILIKQSENIDGNIIDGFASVISKIKASTGIVVGFSFNDDVYREIVRAKRNYRIEIKKVTVKDLIQRKTI